MSVFFILLFFLFFFLSGVFANKLKAAAKAWRWKKERDDKRQKSRTDVFDQIMAPAQLESSGITFIFNLNSPVKTCLNFIRSNSLSQVCKLKKISVMAEIKKTCVNKEASSSLASQERLSPGGRSAVYLWALSFLRFAVFKECCCFLGSSEREEQSIKTFVVN